MIDYERRWKLAEIRAQAAEAQVADLRAKLAEMTTLASDCIVAIATLDNRHHEVEPAPEVEVLVVVLG